jgi:DNA-binding NarL/FixJ family response regulator
MATGATNARIATRLVVSEHTVKSHVEHILGKLRAANRAEAVARAAGPGHRMSV